jgi:hypothetical protein
VFDLCGKRHGRTSARYDAGVLYILGPGLVRGVVFSTRNASKFKNLHNGYIVAACTYEVWRNESVENDDGGVLPWKREWSNARGTVTRVAATCSPLYVYRFEVLVVSAKQLQADVSKLPRCFRLRARRAAMLGWLGRRLE